MWPFASVEIPKLPNGTRNHWARSTKRSRVQQSCSLIYFWRQLGCDQDGHWAHMRLDLRWHRVNFDGLFGRVNLNSNSSATYVDTHQQITNILTKILSLLAGVVCCCLCLALKLNLSIAAAKSNRSYQSKDYVQMFIGASSKSKPKNKRVHVLAAVPHDKSSPLSTAQEETHCDVKSL